MARPAVPVGTIRIHKRGKRKRPFAQIKTPDGWVSAARQSWTTNHGEIPAGYRLDHIDGDPLNHDLANLQIIPVGVALQRAMERRPERFAAGATKRVQKLNSYNQQRSFFQRRFRFIRGLWYPVVISEGIVLLDPHPTRAALEAAYQIGPKSLIAPALGRRFVDGDLIGYRRVNSLSHLLEKCQASQQGRLETVDESDD